MIFQNNKEDTRSSFFNSWKKHLNNEPLSALEQQLVDVISEHLEFQDFFTQKTLADADELITEDKINPFLHLGLHLALRDQITLDRPLGIKTIYEGLLQRHGDKLYVEHLMIEPLALCLLDAQRNNTIPDEGRYLNACKELLL